MGKYEEALERAKAFIKRGGEYDRQVMESIFPELKESEDERIRKELLAFVRVNISPEATCLVRGGSVTRAQAEAYLEKQKEQKPEISDEAIRDGVVHFGITQYQIDYWLKKHINVVEQKPAEWSEEEEKMRRMALECLDHISCESKIPVVNWLKSLPERFNLPPKKEWSEEDKKKLNGIINCLCSTSGDIDGFDEWYDWLKNLPNRFALQPKQE